MRLLVSILILAATGVASADGTMPDGSSLVFKRLFIHENNSQDPVLPAHDPTSTQQYFNFAHCVCSQPNSATKDPYYETSFHYEIGLNNPGTPPLQVPAQIWVGTSCDADIMTRNAQCHQITSASITDVGSIANTSVVTPDVPIFDLMNPEPNPEGCQQRALASAEWVFVDTDNSGAPDYFVSQAITTDSLPPPLPTQFTAEGAENAIQISWTAPTGNIADIAYYQALCSTDGGAPGRTDPPAARYITPRTLCGAAFDLSSFAPSDVTVSTARHAPDVMDAPDAAPDAKDFEDAAIPFDASTEVELPQGLSQLDPAFICGETTDATATSLRLENLKNGVPYTVVLLSIDLAGNASGTYFTSTMTPHPVTDFWEDLHNKGDHIDGGFCLLAETYGDDNPLTSALRSFRDHTLAETSYGRWLTAAYYKTLAPLGAYVQGHIMLRILCGILLLPLVVFALLWHVLTLPGLFMLGGIMLARRRLLRSRSKIATQIAAAGAVALVMLSPTRAHAQSPYWEDQTTGETTDAALADEPTVVKWHAGLRGGPYTPQIDSQTSVRNSAGQGPYQAMFGGYSVLPMLDVDRFLWTGLGQLGVGISVGYMGKTAHAFTDASDPNDPNRTRSPGDTTSFRLIPLQLTAVYRFSYLDDEYGIPIVPYVRGGFGYYVWWSTDPAGNFSRAPMDLNNRAIGATAGLVGALGIAIRAERIDAEAARSMHESGLEHAGFYGEVNAGWVDGFGKQTKLDVGDTTWFAGVDFEF
ncbi:MAG: MXAN_2562 family outer membrane beta-barrel protein [Kofleriaceae bacterium]